MMKSTYKCNRAVLSIVDPFGKKFRAKQFYKNLVNKRSDFFIWSRSLIISSSLIGKRVAIHKGNGFLSIRIRPPMVGRKFGEFAFTRRFGKIHKIYKRSSKRLRILKSRKLQVRNVFKKTNITRRHNFTKSHTRKTSFNKRVFF